MTEQYNDPLTDPNVDQHAFRGGRVYQMGDMLAMLAYAQVHGGLGLTPAQLDQLDAKFQAEFDRLVPQGPDAPRPPSLGEIIAVMAAQT